MVKQPHIALFQPHESIETLLMQLLAKHLAFTYEKINSIEELKGIQSDNPDTFDLIMIPSLLSDRKSAVTISIQLKSDELLSPLPIFVLSAIKDIPAISTFYGSGADVVMALPIDTQLLNLQVTSIYRMGLSYREDQKSIERDKGLRQAIISALHFVEEALVIFDANANLVFSNQTAKQLLNLYDDLQSTNIQKAYTLLQNICVQAMEEIKKGKSIIRHNNINLVKNTGETIKADMRITALKAFSGDTIAYCLSIVDISTPGEISSTLLQSEKSQFLSLLLASACMQLLNTGSLGSPVNPLAKIEQIFARENPICSLNTIATSLLEFIDNIAINTQMIKLQIPGNFNIAMKPSDLFIMTGNLIFYCLKSSFSKSETNLSFEQSSNSFYGTLKIRTKNSADIDQSKEVKASSAIRSEYFALTHNTNSSFSTGLEQAKKIASKYKIQIQEIKSADNQIEMEIDLPLAV